MFLVIFSIIFQTDYKTTKSHVGKQVLVYICEPAGLATTCDELVPVESYNLYLSSTWIYYTLL